MEESTRINLIQAGIRDWIAFLYTKEISLLERADIVQKALKTIQKAQRKPAWERFKKVMDFVITELEEEVDPDPGDDAEK